MSVLILTERDLRACVSLDREALEQVQNAFTWLADGRVEMPPVMHIDVGAHGDLDIKGAYVRGLDAFAVKLASGFFGNLAQGFPSSSSILVLFSAKTGFCKCVLLDNGYLMDLRTGLAGAVCARYLAPSVIHTAGIVGAGAQARYQIESLRLVRDFERLLVFARSSANVQRYVSEMHTKLGIPVEPADSLEQLVRESQVVVTTMPSTEPLIHAEWLHPGLHITAMGSDLPGKQELQAKVLGTLDLLVCDSHAQCAIGGELQHALSRGIVDDKTVVELGQITSGRVTGRTSEQQITVADLTGTGVQDTAIALEAFRKATMLGMGTEMEGR